MRRQNAALGPQKHVAAGRRLGLAKETYDNSMELTSLDIGLAADLCPIRVNELHEVPEVTIAVVVDGVPGQVIAGPSSRLRNEHDARGKHTSPQTAPCAVVSVHAVPRPAACAKVHMPNAAAAPPVQAGEAAPFYPRHMTRCLDSLFSCPGLSHLLMEITIRIHPPFAVRSTSPAFAQASGGSLRAPLKLAASAPV